MKRFVWIVLVALIVFSITSQAEAANRAFDRFQNRVCQADRVMNRKAGPSVLRFSDLIYNEAEQTPETLEAGGRELRRAYVIYQRFNKRILAMRAPASSKRLWRKYGQQERVVLRLGFKGARALEAADLPNFNRVKARNENWQARRNTTWLQIGLVC